MSDLTPAARVEAWNREHDRRTYVVYHCMIHITVSEAFVNADGQAMIFINTEEGPVPLEEIKLSVVEKL